MTFSYIYIHEIMPREHNFTLLCNLMHDLHTKHFYQREYLQYRIRENRLQFYTMQHVSLFHLIA